MIRHAWHPFDEAEATGNRAAFIEWLRATDRLPDADPVRLLAWENDAPMDFSEAIAAFIGVDRDSPAACLFAPCGPREALVLCGSGRRAWSRDAVRNALPAEIARTVHHIDRCGLLHSLADHLLRGEIRPDDRLLWAGPVSDPWPFGVLALGATLILADDPAADLAALAAAEAARPLTRPRDLARG